MKKKSFAVIGLSLFGTSLAKTLYELGQDVIAIDTDLDKVEGIKDFVSHAKQAEVTDTDSLRQAGVAHCDVAIVAKSDEKSIITTIILKELGVKTIVAKTKDELHRLALQKVGATKVIFPEKEFGVRLANQLITSDILEHIELSKDYWIKEVDAPKHFFNCVLNEIKSIDHYGVLIIAIKRDDDLIILPSGQIKIKKGDVLVIMGKTKDVEKFNGVH